MPAIATTDQQLIKFYLGYTSESVPFGDQAIFKRRVTDRTDWESAVITEIAAQVQRCKRTWEEIEEAGDDISYRRNITGDVNRSDLEYRSERWEKRKKIFVNEANELAVTLGVRNYRDPANRKYLHHGLPNP